MNREFSTDRTLFDALIDAVVAHGAGVSIISEQQGTGMNYRRLLQASLALGRLLARSTEPLENVGILLPNIGATLGAIFGLQAWRRVPALLNFSAGIEPMLGACRVAGVRQVVTSRRFIEAAQMQSHIAALSGLRVTFLEDLRSQLTWGDRLRATFDATRQQRRFGISTGPDDPAVVLFTSGSEGLAKGVVLSHRAILSNILQMRTAFPFTTEDKFLSVLPIYHSYGLTACTLMPVLSGTPVCFYTNPLHYHLIPEITRSQGCRVLFGTSTFLGHYARHAQPADFAGVRYVIAGGEKLSDEVVELWRERFDLPVYQGYGCTECAPVIALNTPTAQRRGSIGRLLPGIEYHLQSVPGIARGGELHVRGKNLMLGYYLNDHPGVLVPPTSSRGEGWHGTGDVVEEDGDNFLYFISRLKRFAKIAGEMLPLDLVESIAYRASPEHHHAAVTENIQGGESTLLYTTDAALGRAQLAQVARNIGQGELAAARRIVHVAEIPRLGNGKVDYGKLCGDPATR